MKMATSTKKKAAAYRSTRDGVLIAAVTNMVSMHLSFQTESVSYTSTKRIILPRLLRLPWRRSGRVGEHAAADHHIVAVAPLSLIHICRCRRIERGSSR